MKKCIFILFSAAVTLFLLACEGGGAEKEKYFKIFQMLNL